MKKQYRVGLTGAHGVGKTHMVEKIKKGLEAEGLKVGIVESPTRMIKALGFKNNIGGDWELEMLCVSERLMRQRRVALEDFDVILADRVLFDEAAYTRQLLEGIMDEQSMEGRQQRQFLHWVYEQATYLAVQDRTNYWDEIWMKPVHPDFAPVADGDRLADAKFQQDIQNWIGKLLVHYAPQAKIAPVDRDEAAEVVLQNILHGVQSWKAREAEFSV